jgi:LysM repeat protein
MKKQKLLLSSLLLFSLFSMARTYSEPDNSSVVDSTRMNHLVPNHILLTDSIVNFGKFFLNTPYHYGSPGISSFDCSGFTSHVYRNFGYNLERSSCDQAKQFDPIDRTQLKAGDLVFFSGRHKSKKVGHVGIVVSAKENGDFDFIHAAVHSGVTISNSNEEYYTKRFIKASRVIGTNQILSISKFITKGENKNKEIASFSPVTIQAQTIKKTIPAEYHQVQKGETLSSISKKYGLTVAELKRKNNIKGHKLSLNESIKVKDEETDLIVQAPAHNQTLLAENINSKNPEILTSDQPGNSGQSNKIHSVKKGETLFSISRIYNMSIDELKNINNIIKGSIHPGQKLKITHSIEPSKNETFAKAEENHKPSIHKVVSGESLYSISKTNDIPLDELMRINGITNGKVHPGQKLKLNVESESRTGNAIAEKSEVKQNSKEEKYESTNTHKIKKGENLGSIAKANNMTVDELMKINNLADSKIHQGQELKVIQKNESKNQNSFLAKSEKKQGDKIENKEKSGFHKIKKGENLGSIAKANNISIDELKSINNLTDSKIKPGQELKLTASLVKPKTNSSKTENESRSIHHKVKSGESFYTIAKIYGCSVEELKDWNRKSGSKIKVGEKIVIMQKVNRKDLTLVE